jgi:class 3 adenylate cyclase
MVETHLGVAVEESDGDPMGDGVNIAARLKVLPSPARSVCSNKAAGKSRGGSIWRSAIWRRRN